MPALVMVNAYLAISHPLYCCDSNLHPEASVGAKLLDQGTLVELLKDYEVPRREPRHCSDCDSLLVLVFEEGRHRPKCVQCQDVKTNAESAR